MATISIKREFKLKEFSKEQFMKVMSSEPKQINFGEKVKIILK